MVKTHIELSGGFYALLCNPVGAVTPDWERMERLIEHAEEMRAALEAAIAAMEAQDELVELTALGDFSTQEHDKRRSELEMMNGVFVAELRALLASIDGTEAGS
jgi:hypothetical protein